MTKLTFGDLEVVRQKYGIAQGDLLEDLGQVGVLEEVGMRLQRWAQLRDVPMEYALTLREYLDQEKQEANREVSYKMLAGPGAGQIHIGPTLTAHGKRGRSRPLIHPTSQNRNSRKYRFRGVHPYTTTTPKY
jgi:hypothetical protein